MLEGNIANAKLFNSTVTIGSTVVALGTITANLAGLNSVTATNFIGNATTVTNGVYTNSIGAVTDIMLAGNIANNKLANSSITVNGTSISLGSSATIKASTTNALTIGTGLSGSSFDGGSAVTIALATGYGDTQNPYASKTANYVLAAPNGSSGAPTFRAIVAADIPTLNQNTTGSAATLTTARNINGVSFNGSADITVTAAAGTLTGTELNSTVVTSSLTSVGTLNGLTVNKSTSGTALSITASNAAPYGGTATWQFVGNGNIGGVGSWISFPNGSVQTTAWTGSVAYSSVTGTPTLATVATSGSYADLSNKPTLFDGAYESLSGKPTLFSGSYTDLTNKPTNVSSFTNDSNYLTSVSWSQVTDKPQNIVTLNDTDVITNGMLVNDSITVGSTAVALGSSITTLTGLTGVTSNAATAFIAGTAAESGVALQMPREGALRNLTNGANNNMYFDVSVGGTSQGQFQFRSSSAFTNVLTMSPTAFNVNPDAVVTARTPSFGRLPWNSAIDTELTIDDYRFRVSNSGGNFPQVISNVSGQTKNSAWTVVAARSGSAITQTGSTGTLVPNNAWTTLYNSAGMDSAGDTYVCTLQDKNQGRIYRVTFMRSDNGATTGYNIIAERLL
jgi:hypothetical protein